VLALIQRVSWARVEVDGKVVGKVDRGLLILLGARDGDDSSQAEYLAEKVAGLRIFNDDAGKMNHSLVEVGGGALVVSQFTLHADERQGRRPSFIAAAKPEAAEKLYQEFIGRLRALGIPTESGIFGAMMQVSLCNDGPVTIMVKSKNEYTSK
jgi:D-tyrosyl-tRNA(Tyr) deacylase